MITSLLVELMLFSDNNIWCLAVSSGELSFRLILLTVTSLATGEVILQYFTAMDDTKCLDGSTLMA